jgi:diguanylate cyclase (GGDEF)-like protein
LEERNVKRAPLTPDEATQRDQVRRFLNVLTAAAAAAGGLLAVQGVESANGRSLAIAIAVLAFAALLVVWPRRILAQGRVQAAVTVVALATSVLIFSTAVISPSGALVAATALLIPITAAVPYLEIKRLRWLMVFAWVGTVATAAASLLPDPSAAAPTTRGSGLLWGTALVSGLVLFLLYQSSERLKASSREFSRLFSLSSDLAEAADPGVLGDLVARHLTEATGMDDCVIYARAPETGRLSAFGSHPAQRAVETDADTLVARPMLQRVIHERVHATVDVLNEHADAAERAHLSGLGRSVMLLLPLVAHGDPLGVAELTSVTFRTLDDRRLALARTLAFEAAMAIENGRLYHELRERSLHDPLTGLANRSLFFDRVGHAIARLGRQSGESIAVLFIDLDSFKSVNDTLGHARGDRLLALVAERLKTVVRATDTVARLGGDEFALLLEGVTIPDGPVIVAERALSLLSTPFDLHGQPVSVSASIGIAVQADAKTGAEKLIHQADAAMYEAKRAGKGRAIRSAPVSLGVRGPVA